MTSGYDWENITTAPRKAKFVDINKSLEIRWALNDWIRPLKAFESSSVLSSLLSFKCVCCSLMPLSTAVLLQIERPPPASATIPDFFSPSSTDDPLATLRLGIVSCLISSVLILPTDARLSNPLIFPKSRILPVVMGAFPSTSH